MSALRRALLGAVMPAVLLGGIVLGVPASAGASAPIAVSAPTQYVVALPVCATHLPGHASCLSRRLVRASAATPGARQRVARADSATYAVGPAGGYTPADLASAYGINPDTPAATQTIALVDAFNDPTIVDDLNHFDSAYGLPPETFTSFQVLNQSGSTAPLPPDDTSGWSIEEALDVEAARAVCHTCKLLLVEAADADFDDLATAVNTAAALGATEISNSYGGAETANSPAADTAAYDHPGVVITASTGDDGWYDWDSVNDGYSPSTGPEEPAALNTVVAVGGTSLYLNADGTRAGERVWNGNGPYDRYGNSAAGGGATGGGCSAITSPQPWQSAVATYASLGCGTYRSATDIAAVADPLTGFDMYSGFAYSGNAAPGWITVGGTSLASPVVAAMWALAGGAKSVPYPSLTLYGHYKSAPATYDVTIGGNGLCDTASTTTCTNMWGGNPNTVLGGNVDCGLAPVVDANGDRGQCYAQVGYDGPSGVGTPVGLKTFTKLLPTAKIVGPTSVKLNTVVYFGGGQSTDPFPGATFTKYQWKWGDGTRFGTARISAHKWTTTGIKTVTLTVTDSYGQSASVTQRISVTL